MANPNQNPNQNPKDGQAREFNPREPQQAGREENRPEGKQAGRQETYEKDEDKAGNSRRDSSSQSNY